MAPGAAAGAAGAGGDDDKETSAVLFRRLTEQHPRVPKRRLLSLLARVRSVVAWRGGLEARRAAVRGRIMALTALVYCHPSQGGRGEWGVVVAEVARMMGLVRWDEGGVEDGRRRVGGGGRRGLGGGGGEGGDAEGWGAWGGGTAAVCLR